MKILLTGANGFLGQHLCLYLAEKGFAVSALSRGAARIPATFPFDYYSVELTDEAAVRQLVNAIQPDVVIHAAAKSKPDECQEHQDECLLHNVQATAYLLHASAALQQQPHFIFISTDFVFGENGPHAETDEPAPLNFYGQSKLMAEKLVLNSGLPAAIVRPVFIYGPVWPGLRGSFLHWVQQQLQRNEAIKVVSDQVRTPTFVTDICRSIAQIIAQKAKGFFHIAGDDRISPYDMAVATATNLGLDAALITKVTSDTFKEPVIRAKRSGLTTMRARQELGFVPTPFTKGLELTFHPILPYAYSA